MIFQVYYYDTLLREIGARDMSAAATQVGQIFGGQAGIKIYEKGAYVPSRTFHYTEHDVLPGYVMFGFFSFQNGKLNIGQCQSVKIEDAQRERDALHAKGWTKAGYRYVNGKPELVRC